LHHLSNHSDRRLSRQETSHPPTYYIPPADINHALLGPVPGKHSFCEWKGSASYFTVAGRPSSAWTYTNPTDGFLSIKDHVAFYPSKFECFVGDERVQSQEGDFYGGWITKNLQGPFKGGPGTMGW
jgi:uncharacterized protein (DUF427 family)